MAVQGRPSIYSKELADKICEQLSEGDSLRTVCKPDGMPSKATVFMWLRTKPEFLDQYTRAKEEAADALADEIMDIADDSTNDWMDINADDGSGERYRLNGEHVQRAKLRIETRKWIMAKAKPKKYGDKLDVTSGGEKLPAPLYGGQATKTDD